MNKDTTKINENIKSNIVNVITITGENIWQMCLNEALEMAYSQDLDLVELSVKEGISIVKIINYWKYQYEQQKKQKKNATKPVETKIVKITYKIGNHDLSIKENQVLKFAEEWHNVKITMQLKGRERYYENIGLEKMKDFVKAIIHVYSPQGEIQSLNWNFSIILKPIKKR